MLQAIAQVVFQCASEHVSVEGRMEGKQRTVADELHERQQCFGRVAAGGDCAGCQAMDQHARPELLLLALQGALELLAEIDSAVFDHHRADGQHLILVQVQAGGFQVHHYPALFPQAALIQG